MKTTEQKIINFVNENNLIESGDKLLIALSGGADSVFVLNFFVKFLRLFKINLAAFHLNHLLRGKDSDDDEFFCRSLCENLNIEFGSERIDVRRFARENKLSVEEAARNLRYKALDNFAENSKCSKIVTAHNLDDNAETVLLNLINGAGLKGISGIPIRRGKIIRPILCLSKNEILKYSEESNFKFRTDKSNFSSEYSRNFLRNEVIPLIKSELNESFSEAVFRTSRISASADRIIKSDFENWIKNGCEFKDNSLRVFIDKNFNRDKFAFRIKSALKKYFNFESSFEDNRKIISLIDSQTGTKAVFGGKLKAVRERNAIVFGVKSSDDTRVFSIVPGGSADLGTIRIFSRLQNPDEVEFSDDSEFIAGDKLESELTIRRWKAGDKFIPLGMEGAKNVSDFLTDVKIPAAEKENVFVMLNGNEIVWVVGFRIDNRYKINENTKKIYKLWIK